MGRGFLAGIFWGGVVGVGLLLVSSQSMDRQQLSFPRPEASPVEVPAGTEFDQAREDTEPVLPAIEEAPGADEVVTGVIAPQNAGDEPPAFDTSALEVPQPTTDGPTGLGEVPEVSDQVTIPAPGSDDRIGSEGNTASSPVLRAPVDPAEAPATDTASPEPTDAPEVDQDDVAAPVGGEGAPEAEAAIAALPSDTPTEQMPEVGIAAPGAISQADAPAAPVSPEISEAPSMPGVRVPESDETPSEPQVAARVVPAEPEARATPPEAPPAPEDPSETESAQITQPEVAAEETAPSEPASQGTPPAVTELPESSGVVTVDGGDSQFFTPVETFEDRADNVETDRLPTISSGADQSGGLPAVRRLPGNPIELGQETAPEETSEAREPVEGPAIERFGIDFDRPSGSAAVSVILLHDGSEIMANTDLEALPDTIAFAVDAGAPNAAAIAASYRAAGREVVMIPSLPQGATPQDVEVALGISLDRVPEAVAVMDVSGSSFQADREAIAQVVAVVSDSGHGLITYPRGLNAAHQQAERAGVPTGLIFRILDEDGETGEQIRRTLDRAAFRARQSDAVILVGHTRQITMAAIREWAPEVGGDVTLAPISSALTDG